MAKLFKKKFIATMAGLVAVTCLAGFLTNFMNRGDEECDHKKTVAIPGVAATCDADGLTEGKKCKDCGEVIEKQKAIPATGEHLDSDTDYSCDACGTNMSPTANMVEVALADLDNPNVIIAGKWLRVYKPTDGEERVLYTMGYEEGDSPNPDDYKQFRPVCFNIEATGFYLTGTPFYIEGMEIIETEAYFDIHFEIGEYKVYVKGGGFMFDSYVVANTQLDNDSYEGFYLLEPPAAE